MTQIDKEEVARCGLSLGMVGGFFVYCVCLLIFVSTPPILERVCIV
jgi:hypothetical protein